ncbi:1-phosphofructokinase family hexose kinase [Pseudoflavitalea sp. X16]|uniref:1-phosphofructokinase family hexose kinase n=1 Tax=Paraflavitalea devenefica TaxID=2716334 RepID=UPI0014249DC3|nr:1-phosphofructokinase family hexose kinase [Paraflavitalea devenefica]NII24544.1 1-phosphofructokinase family hexose kinase [Paraflavitalea devenefica]
MIVTITMNPAIDKSTSVEKLVPEKKLRCTAMMAEAGGGGINISKAIKELGGESLAIFPSGGINGKLIEDYLTGKQVAYKTIPIGHETRENIMVRESSTNAQYRFVMPGAELSQREVNACFHLLQQLPDKPTIIVASGSLPPGIPEDFFAQLAATAKKLGARFIADTSGKPLLLAAQEGVFLLKPNMSELCSLVGKDFLELEEVDDAARQVINKGECEAMVVSMGPAGAMWITKDGQGQVPAPVVKKQSTVGAGDSMVAGITWMLQQGKSLQEAVYFGVACGTAATMNAGTQLFKKTDVLRLYEWIKKQVAHK